MSEHNDNPHDEQISRLYRLGSSGEPPADLDRKILDEAQRTVGHRWQRIRPWPSLATAAVLVLSFSLLLRVTEHEPLDQISLPEEEILLDTAIAPVSQEAESDAEATTEGVEVAPPPPAATSRLKTGTMRSREGSPMPAQKLRKEIVIQEQPAKAATPAPNYSAPALSPDGMVGGVMQVDKAAVVPLAKPKAIAESKGCGVALPVAEQPASAWQQLYRELLEQEKREQAECLREIYEQRFGQQLKLGQKPDSSVE